MTGAASHRHRHSRQRPARHHVVAGPTRRALSRRRFDLLTSAEQLDELMRVTRYPRLRERLAPAVAGHLVNDLRALAVTVDNLPVVEVSADPDDNYLLALAAAGTADFLVTDDKGHLLGLSAYAGTKIVTVRDFLALLGRLP